MLQTKKAAAEACAAKCCTDIQSSNEAAAVVAGYSLELLFVQICAVFRVLIVSWWAHPAERSVQVSRFKFALN